MWGDMWMGHGKVRAGVPEPLVVLALSDAVANQEGETTRVSAYSSAGGAWSSVFVLSAGFSSFSALTLVVYMVS